MPLPNWLRYVNKRFTNRLTMRLARLPLSPISIVYHTGRKSGKLYRTPVIAEPVEDGFLFALTYGEEVDWYHNVLASGKCELLWRGKKFELENPESVPAQVARDHYPFPFKYILRLAGIQGFFQMRIQQ
jgi:deazaflavin-dependent oxidoreductase (nitroreductase family)